MDQAVRLSFRLKMTCHFPFVIKGHLRTSPGVPPSTSTRPNPKGGGRAWCWRAIMDKQRHHELFGSDSEFDSDEDDTPPATEAAVPSSGAEAAEEVGDEEGVGEGDLFGSASEDEDDEGQPAAAAPPSVPSAPPLRFELPSMPQPPKDAQLYLARLPNILTFEPRPFEPETFEDSIVDEEGRLKTQNVIRWRDGGEGQPRQSNARLAKWSDGSMTLHVGSEVLSAQEIKVAKGSTQLFLRHKGSNLECHGLLNSKLSFQPASISSATHRLLTQQIARQHVKERKIKMTATIQDPEKKKMDDEKVWEEGNRLEARRAARRERDAGMRPELSEEFLDADDDELDGNLGAIRRRFKDRKRKAGSAPAGGGGAPSRPKVARKKQRRMNSDDEEEEDDDDEDEEEEEGEGDPREMDGFIVEDEEAEESDPDDED